MIGRKSSSSLPRASAQLFIEGHEAAVLLGSQFLLLDLLVLALEQLLGGLRHAPKWYSSKMTRSQLVVWTHVLRLDEAGLPVAPEQVWNEPK